jgi:hypothetical protein
MDNEIELGKGAIRDIPDIRDYQWGRDVGMASPPVDWKKGYDVEEEISALIGQPFKIKVKDQNGSSSCGGQAWGYLGQVLNAFHDGNTDERSAKFIYNQTHVGQGGSGGRENCTVCIRDGWGFEADCPSYENGKPPSEAFMVRTGDITPQARERAKVDKAFAYANVGLDVEIIAQAVRDNHGCIFGITGNNNGTWRSEYPKPPLVFANSWNHWIYIGKLKLRNGKRYFGTINSWGTSIGDDGWQWISEEYVMHKILQSPVIFSVWTMVIKDEVIVPPPPVYVFTKTLRLGMTGPDVKMLQLKLGGLIVDGKFGTGTLGKVKAFQTAHGLVADGVVGPKTNAELNK